MIHTPENCKQQVVDCRGNIVPGAASFNDETFEIEAYAIGANNRPLVSQVSEGKVEMLKVKFILLGAKLVDRKTT